MRLALLIFIVSSFCLCFGQDSLKVDTTLKPETIVVLDTVIIDSALSIVKDKPAAKKTKRKKVKPLPKKDPVVSQKEDAKPVKDNNDGNVIIIIGIFIIAIIAIFKYTRLFFNSKEINSSVGSQGEEELSDYLSRQLLPRREYYRNVYLKSEAWKRKRFLVLKRDNWRCVYCGGKATQVHHTRYAKRNIGKEPIEWLVSICKACHDAKH